jgi:hypothetical protein
LREKVYTTKDTKFTKGFKSFLDAFLCDPLPAIASRHVRHRLRLRQCRAGSGEAGGFVTFVVNKSKSLILVLYTQS